MTPVPPLQSLPRARGLVVALVGFGLPVLAHVSAGGSVSLPPVTLLPLAVVATLCVTASSKVWTFWRLALALSGVGVLTHAALWAGQAPIGPSDVHLAMHAAAGQTAPSAMAGGGMAESATGHAMGLSPLMVAAHLMALALSVILLRQGEVLWLWLTNLVRRRRPQQVAIIRATYPRAQTPRRRSTAEGRLYLASGGPRAPPLALAH